MDIIRHMEEKHIFRVLSRCRVRLRQAIQYLIMLDTIEVPVAFFHASFHRQDAVSQSD